ncbi:DnaJ C-terminal domain-containing protein [Simplicispira psychrophila]|uniref:DnaJ C-terminal domain-containing protein n=1 Tax=Simplicispira psychrophila TaxID=80882 RepID=UPI000483FA84|nr:DnaJ C-terminal domain-containing protein [Simplicispira psychrophila]
MEFKDYYKALGVAKTASADEIKKAYRKLVRKYHPDVSKEADASERMTELNEANAVLSDPEKRAAYDSLGTQPRRDSGGFRPPPNWDAGFEFSGANAGPGGGAGEYSDFFEELFGRAARAQHGTRGQRTGGFDSTPQPQRGEDHHAKIELDILDAYHGSERTITLRGAHLDDSGHVAHDERSLQVKIPKGVREGQLIRLVGQGSPGSGGAAAGNLFLEVRFAPHARWRAEGRDVYQALPLAPWEAALGASVEVKTPAGTVEVTVPAHSRAGRKLRLKGRGIPSTPPGDLYLELTIEQPSADSDSARTAYAALSKAFPTFNPRQSRTGD